MKKAIAVIVVLCVWFLLGQQPYKHLLVQQKEKLQTEINTVLHTVTDQLFRVTISQRETHNKQLSGVGTKLTPVCINTKLPLLCLLEQPKSKPEKALQPIAPILINAL